MVFIDENKYKDFFGIYQIRNLENGFVYVGQTCERFQRRYWHHAWTLSANQHCNKYLQRAWNKYGSDKFVFEVVECVSDVDILDNLEMKYIQIARETVGSYNISAGGGGVRGIQMGEDQKRKIGEKNRVNMTGRKASEETKAKMRESSKHISPTEQHREILRKYMSERIVSENTKEKIADAFRGSKSYFAVLNEDHVARIKRLLMCGLTRSEIAKIYPVSYSAISGIDNDKHWTHVHVDGWNEYIKSKK